MEGLGFALGGAVKRSQGCRGRRVVRMVSTSPAEASVAESVKDDFGNYVMNTYARYDVTLEKGVGVKVYDTTGKEYFDFVAGIATCCLGHANPVLRDAISDQIATLHHVSNLYYIPEQGKLAKQLVDNSVADKVFFCNSGAEANEAAIKLARKYASVKRDIHDGVILTANKSFHGRTLATITATGQPKYQENFTPLVPGFDYIGYNDTASLEAAFSKYGDRVIGVMLEACQGEGGVLPGDKAFFAKARQLCTAHDALLILDEVQVGVGRTGKLWGFENVDVEPDVFTLAKGLGAGVPIGAMLCKEHCNVFKPGDHASTFGGNPLSCAAGLAVMQFVKDPAFLRNVAERGQQLRSKLSTLSDRFPGIIADVRGWGLINGFEINADSKHISSDFVAAAAANGLLLVPAGPKVVRFVPPLVITEAEMTQALDIFESVFESVAQN